MRDFPYIKIKGKSSIPIVDLYFENPKNPSYIFKTDFAVLDTGSDFTIVSFTIINQLQLRPIVGSQTISIRGFGRDSEAVPFLVKVSFDADKYIYTKIFVVPDDVLEGQTIIGRNILNRYVVTFNGPKLIATIFD